MTPRVAKRQTVRRLRGARRTLHSPKPALKVKKSRRRSVGRGRRAGGGGEGILLISGRGGGEREEAPLVPPPSWSPRLLLLRTPRIYTLTHTHTRSRLDMHTQRPLPAPTLAGGDTPLTATEGSSHLGSGGATAWARKGPRVGGAGAAPAQTCDPR